MSRAQRLAIATSSMRLSSLGESGSGRIGHVVRFLVAHDIFRFVFLHRSCLVVFQVRAFLTHAYLLCCDAKLAAVLLRLCAEHCPDLSVHLDRDRQDDPGLLHLPRRRHVLRPARLPVRAQDMEHLGRPGTDRVHLFGQDWNAHAERHGV